MNEKSIPSALLTVMAIAFLIAGRASRAAPIAQCPTGVALSAVLGTTCTIGDKTFGFTTPISGSDTAFESGSTGNADAPTPDELLFVTSSNGGNPGFELSAEPGFSLTVNSVSTDEQDALIFALLYSASITDPSSGALITGTTVTTTGVTLNETDPIDPASEFASLALGQLADTTLSCETNEAASGAVDFGDTPQLLPPNSATLPCSGVLGSFAALEVLIGGDISGDNPNGTASLTSVGTFVDESTGYSTAVPEPSTIALGLGALLPMGLYSVRRRSARKRRFTSSAAVSVSGGAAPPGARAGRQADAASSPAPARAIPTEFPRHSESPRDRRQQRADRSRPTSS